jgi:hypothetical protein
LTKGGEPVDITDRLLPNLNAGSQKPPETVSEVEKSKNFLGVHACLQTPLVKAS